jgi:hypothetical protein
MADKPMSAERQKEWEALQAQGDALVDGYKERVAAIRAAEGDNPQLAAFEAILDDLGSAA